MTSTNVFQNASLFTARVWLNKPHPMTRQNKATYHSWRQEIKIANENKIIDHRHAWIRIQQCLFNLQSITDTGIIYFNLTGEEVFKIVKGKVVAIQEIKFQPGKQLFILMQGYKRGDGHLWKIEDSTIQAHCNINWKFWSNNSDYRKANFEKYKAANRVEKEFES